MTPRQIETLKAIKNGYKTPSEIALAIDKSRSGTSQILRILTDSNCITYETDKMNRSSVIYSLTEIGKTALEQA